MQLCGGVGYLYLWGGGDDSLLVVACGGVGCLYIGVTGCICLIGGVGDLYIEGTGCICMWVVGCGVLVHWVHGMYLLYGV